MKLKNVKRLKTVTDILTALNIVASVVCFFIVCGSVGTMDYNTEMHIIEDETYLMIQAFVAIGLMVLTTFIASKLRQFSDFLDYCIEVRVARIRQKRIQIRMNENRNDISRRAIR